LFIIRLNAFKKFLNDHQIVLTHRAQPVENLKFAGQVIQHAISSNNIDSKLYVSMLIGILDRLEIRNQNINLHQLFSDIEENMKIKEVLSNIYEKAVIFRSA
jgi:hypothetical protein